MNTGIEKIAATKQSVRKDLAKRSYTDKLAALENMRADGTGLTKIPIGDDSNTNNGQDSSESALQRLIKNVEADLKGARGGDDLDSLSTEVSTLMESPEELREFLQELFPDGLPIDNSFFSKVHLVQRRTGWNETTQRFVARLIEEAVNSLSVEDGHLLLHKMAEIRGSDFFMLLQALPGFLQDNELQFEFAADWFVALLDRIGNDLASDGFWRALKNYCGRRSTSSIAVLEVLLERRDDSAIAVGAFLLGTLRGLGLEDEVDTELQRIDQRLRSVTSPHQMSLFDRSWIPTAQLRHIEPAEIQLLEQRFELLSPDDSQRGFWILGRILTSKMTSEECRELGLEWIHEQSELPLTPEAQYRVMELVINLSSDSANEARELAVRIQPIEGSRAGTWKLYEHFLVKQLEKDVETFSSIFVQIAEANAEGLLAAMKTPRAFEWLLSEMGGRDVNSLLVRLIFSASTGLRLLGFFLLDRLENSELPSSLVDKLSEDRLLCSLLEFQRHHLKGATCGKFLRSLAARAVSCSQQFREELRAELQRQLRDQPQSCLKAVEQDKGNPLVAAAIEDSETYFEAIRKARESGVLTMDVPRSRKYSRISARRFANDVAAGANSLSTFASLFKSVRLIYGRNWRTFCDGNLGESGALKEISSSMELPRLAFIEPEDVVHRRMFASKNLDGIENGDESVKETRK